MRAKLRDDLKAALGARDRAAIIALRFALSAIDNAESVFAGGEVSAGEVSAGEVSAGEVDAAEPSAAGSPAGSPAEVASAQERPAEVPPAEVSVHVAGGAFGVGTAEAKPRHLTEEDMRAIVQAEVDERLAAAEEYEQHGRSDHADKLRAEAAVLQRHLTPPP